MNIKELQVHELEQFRATLIELRLRTNKRVLIFDDVEVNIEEKLSEIEERLVRIIKKEH